VQIRRFLFRMDPLTAEMTFAKLREKKKRKSYVEDLQATLKMASSQFRGFSSKCNTVFHWENIFKPCLKQAMISKKH
jgi:hypothetical protein